tara:strand:+ start:45 stop:569 length:525 start_codon:yes stop_codon:yes gene_type:complete
MVITEALAGLALVRSACKTINGMVKTCDNVTTLGTHISDALNGFEQTKQKTTIKKNLTWGEFVKTKITVKSKNLNDDSLGAVAQNHIEMLQAKESLKKLEHVINRKFGYGTFQDIRKEYDKRQSNKKVQNKNKLLQKNLRLKKLKKFFIEMFKLVIILTIIGGFWFWLVTLLGK